MTSTKTTKDKVKTKVHSQDSIPSFIRKTYDILEERKFPDVIDWNPEGTALVIKKPSDFCQKVLPAYFKHNNLTSFVRQLNMYNFHKRRTQNIDHVYYHELFQKGKKHLLKEIKRKNHDHGSDKTQKNIENIEPSQSGKDINTLLYENQVLRRLYNDASTKVAVLEGQVRDLTNQNQTLWSQLCSQGDRDMSAFKPLMARVEKNASLTQDQLPMTFGDISIPPLKLEADRQGSIQPALPLAKAGGNVNSYLNLSEASADSTEASHNSPSTQNTTEVDKNLTITSNASTTLQLPQIALNPSLSTLQIKPMISDLFVSRQDMSVGQLFEAWNQEAQNTELICFADQQKNDRNIINVQALFQDPMNMLGKRMFDTEQQGSFADPRFNVPEPLMKRHDLSIFNRRNMISTGTEDKEFLKALIRRESSINEEFDPNNMGVDLMDFNQPFINSTKASS